MTTIEIYDEVIKTADSSDTVREKMEEDGYLEGVDYVIIKEAKTMELRDIKEIGRLMLDCLANELQERSTVTYEAGGVIVSTRISDIPKPSYKGNDGLRFYITSGDAVGLLMKHLTARGCYFWISIQKNRLLWEVRG
jgi:hypothetical protein